MRGGGPPARAAPRSGHGLRAIAGRLAPTLRVMLTLATIGCSKELVVLDPIAEPALEAGTLETREGGAGELDGGQPLLDAALDGSDPVNRPSLRSVSAFAHSCASDETALFCWGDGRNEQFGADGGEPEPSPRLLAESVFTMICTGEKHACALQQDGTLVCWGGNEAGQLGLGDRLARARPTPIGGGLRFSAVACGGLITCAIGMRGELSCWGDNLEGALGQGEMSATSSPSPLRVAREVRMSRVAVGQGHACAIDEGGRLYCWGRNNLGQLGAQPALEQVRVPVQVDPTRQFGSVAAGLWHTCAIALDGRLYCWGNNASPLLGVRSDAGRVSAPLAVGTDADYRQIAASWFHGCAIKRGGALVCWGRNTEGQLGLGDTIDRTAPTRVGVDSDWQTVSAGQFHSCGARAGALYCWGDNREGQLGLNDFARRYVPFAVSLR